MKTKILSLLSWPRLLAALVLILLVLLSTARPLDAQSVAQGYASDQELERGMIVRLVNNDASKVEAVKPSEVSFMHGVVVAPNDAPLTLSSENQKVFVASSGRFEVLVSTQNGEVSPGDYVTISSKDGIGMKAKDEDQYVIGKALMTFNDNSATSGTAQVNGRTVKYGRVITEIKVASNPNFRLPVTSVPYFLQRGVEAISGKPVSNTRVYLALFIAIATMLITGSLLYGGVRSSITAIGRNPLSKVAVGKSLFQISVIGFMIFALGLFAVYLLLKI